MKQEHRDLYLELKRNFPLYAEKCLKIRTKDGDVKPFLLNKAQLYIHEKLEQQRKATGKVRALILKGRQQGCSTYVAARFYHQVTHSLGTKCFIVTHLKDATDNLYRLVQRYHDNVPDLFRPSTGVSNAKELYFDELDSGYAVGTAGSGNIGRSDTIQLLHGCLSEDSLIVLADGSSKSMGDIVIGDEVMTSSGKIAPVSNKIYTGEKQTYKLDVWVSGEAIYLTADHKVLTIDGYKELKDLTRNDYVALPKIELDNSIKSYHWSLKNKERPQGGGSKHIEGYDFDLNKEFGYFIGYYLAEGHIKSGLGYMELAYHKDETFIYKALEGVKGLPTSVKHYKDEGTNRGRTKIYGKFLSTAINDICGRVGDKRIPEWFFRTNKEFLWGVLRGYLDGDGSKTQHDRITAPSIHEKISRQIQRIILALELGSANIRKSERYRYGERTKDIYNVKMFGNTLRRYRDGVSSNQMEVRRVEKIMVKNGQIFCKVKSIEPRKIEKVWDIEVDHKDHNYQTTACVVSNSECAFWSNANEISTGIMQTIPDMKGTEVILESTANGIGNMFHKMSMAAMHGNSEYQLIFVPWFWQDEYRLGVPDDFKLTDEEYKYKNLYQLDDSQIVWRRNKISNFVGGEWQFKQEYPATALEAFQSSSEDSLIQPKTIMSARKCENVHADNQLVIGVDPAWKGKDRTAIVFRSGRVQHRHEIFQGLDTMEVVGRLVQMINHYKPEKIFVDVGGIGAGIYDRCKELGYTNVVVPVNFGQKADDAERYLNKRAEMWDRIKDWLNNGPVKIEDNDELHADLQAPHYTFDSAGKLKIEPKEKIKERYGKSPDLGDALALTFAFNLPNKALKEKYGVGRTYQANSSWSVYD
jgi:hypothetical protein